VVAAGNVESKLGGETADPAAGCATASEGCDGRRDTFTVGIVFGSCSGIEASGDTGGKLPITCVLMPGAWREEGGAAAGSRSVSAT
jgi:hypothetical protein